MADSNDGLVIKDILTVASPLIKSLVDTFVVPKLEKFRDRISVDNSKLFVPTDQHFTEYFHRTYKKLAVINTLVFNNSQRFLNDIFIPLTLVSTNEKNVKLRANGFPKKLSDEYGNILITDTAGMGKSTLMKKIFIDLFSQNVGIPIFIELRRLNSSKKILDEIKEQLDSINKNFNSELLFEILIEGGFVIILDGYDEIALNDRDTVTSDIQGFISKASNNRFFITSRPEQALASFGNFQEFRIEPLTKKEAFELLRKYDSQGQISSLLIKKLQEKDLANIEEFLTNPLLVSLLFTAFEHKQTIPFKKYLFYRQVYDANFESHDLTKGDSYTHNKYSSLEIDDFHRVLRHIGFNCFKIQRIEFTKDELLKLIGESKEFCVGLNFNVSDFLLDILKTVPLFTQDGNYYRWSHKSLQEYFAAQFIYLDSKEKQTAILKKMCSHQNLEKFINVLDLYYDMDYKTFRNIVEYDLLSDYESHTVKSYHAVNDGVTSSEVIRRKELTFMMNSYVFKATIQNGKSPFEDDKLGKMIESLVSAPDQFTGFYVTHFAVDNCIYCLHRQSFRYPLLNLLATKKSPIVRITNRSRFNSLGIKLNFDFNEEFAPKEIVDSINDKLNSVENFISINDLIEATRMQIFVINHGEALTKIKEISKSIKTESEDDFLLDAISF